MAEPEIVLEPFEGYSATAGLKRIRCTGVGVSESISRKAVYARIAENRNFNKKCAITKTEIIGNS